MLEGRSGRGGKFVQSDLLGHGDDGGFEGHGNSDGGCNGIQELGLPDLRRIGLEGHGISVPLPGLGRLSKRHVGEELGVLLPTLAEVEGEDLVILLEERTVKGEGLLVAGGFNLERVKMR